MFEKKEKARYERMIESELERTISCLKMTTLIDSAEYAKMLRTAERLHEMLDKEKPSSVSKEALLTVGANLLGIILIIKHENVNVITSKALGFVIRPRA
jgi:exopolyphosphatase/pppGpp-phosphohydrolase